MENKVYRGSMWKRLGKEPFLRGMWEHYSCERSKVKKFRELADDEKQAGIARSVATGIANQSEEKMEQASKWAIMIRIATNQ